MTTTAAFAVTDSSQIAEPRRAVQHLAERLEFSAERAGRAALVASELATNLSKHARGGEIVVRMIAAGDDTRTGIEILALDKGPGMSDMALSRRDGYSTSGTLGHGLGAIERQADWLDLFTHSSGTAIAARILREKPSPTPRQPRYEIGAVQVAKPGESICGDGWSWRMRDDRLSIFVADGLGHGLAAHDAAQAALDVFAREHEAPTTRILESVHAGLRHTRGAAVAVASIDVERAIAHYAGLGNIAGAILLANGGRHNLVSHNGTAGHTSGRIQEFRYPLPADAVLVMYSDGLSTHWDLNAYPGLRNRSPTLIAGVLYRDFSRRRDDVTVVVAKQRPAVSGPGA